MFKFSSDEKDLKKTVYGNLVKVCVKPGEITEAYFQLTIHFHLSFKR